MGTHNGLAQNSACSHYLPPYPTTPSATQMSCCQLPSAPLWLPGEREKEEGTLRWSREGRVGFPSQAWPHLRQGNVGRWEVGGGSWESMVCMGVPCCQKPTPLLRVQRSLREEVAAISCPVWTPGTNSWECSAPEATVSRREGTGLPP